MTSLVCLVAGLSSRFGGKPKQLEKVGPNNETLIEYSINQALSVKLKNIIFVTNTKTEDNFKTIFGNLYKNIPVYYIKQEYNNLVRARPWGTLDAICTAIPLINSKFIVINGDDIYGEYAYKQASKYFTNNNLIGLVETIKTLPKTGTVNRGIVKIDDKYVKSLDEKIGISIENIGLHNTLSNVNFLCFQPEIIFIFKKYLDAFKIKYENDDKIEILLPDILNEMISKNEIILESFIIEHNILGITNPEDSNIVKNLLINK